MTPEERLTLIREKLQHIVCTEPPDDGVVLLSHDGPTHREMWDGRMIEVYDHVHFSPLGDALIELWELTGGTMEERMLKWFEYGHLPEHLQAVSQPFGDLARRIAETIAAGPERTVALRKLLEAKDAAVRAALNPGS
jgi:hypothetical protein